LSKEENITLEKIVQRGQAGDPLAKKLFEEVGENLGIAIGHMINLLNPRGVILGWSLGQAYSMIKPGIEKTLKKFGLLDLSKDLIMVPSFNGTDDALLGSIALVLDEIIRESI
jgi:predicted NBD/HSP70 family sugar kinase